MSKSLLERLNLSFQILSRGEIDSEIFQEASDADVIPSIRLSDFENGWVPLVTFLTFTTTESGSGKVYSTNVERLSVADRNAGNDL